MATVATLPLEPAHASSLLQRLPGLEADLRLGACFVPAWRQSPHARSASLPLVLMVDVVHAVLRLLEVRALRGLHTRPLPTLAKHPQPHCAEAPPASCRRATSRH